MIGCANFSQSTPDLWQMNILGCLPLAMRNYVLKSVKCQVSLRNTKPQNSIQFDSWWCSTQAYAFECLSCTHWVLLSSWANFILQPEVPFLINWHTQVIYLNKPVQVLNMNHQSISRLESESLIAVLYLGNTCVNWAIEFHFWCTC